VSRVKITHNNPGRGNTLVQFSHVESMLQAALATQYPFNTDDALYGPSTIFYVGSDLGGTTSNYAIGSIQLGTASGITNIMDSAFAPTTYTTGDYTPTVEYGQIDAERLYDTQAIFTAIIPAAEGNGELGTGVTFTEAALKCHNNDWFAHINFGQVYKTNQIRLRIRWTIDLLPL
jgi:hypothetical protein